MEIYLIRHTTPLVEKGICYGQTDLDITESFEAEAEAIRKSLPATIEQVFSSPLQRCSKLANQLFPTHSISLHPHLMELNCGEWEMQYWDAIPKPEIQPWMDDFINVVVPGGESYQQLHDRVLAKFLEISSTGKTSAIVGHGGVLRSILAHITGIELKESFSAFQLHYGAVVKIVPSAKGYAYELLHNITPSTKEQHRPSFT
jgi:alpha-ribazole phosphatase